MIGIDKNVLTTQIRWFIEKFFIINSPPMYFTTVKHELSKVMFTKMAARQCSILFQPPRCICDFARVILLNYTVICLIYHLVGLCQMKMEYQLTNKISMYCLVYVFTFEILIVTFKLLLKLVPGLHTLSTLLVYYKCFSSIYCLS